MVMTCCSLGLDAMKLPVIDCVIIPGGLRVSEYMNIDEVIDMVADVFVFVASRRKSF